MILNAANPLQDRLLHPSIPAGFVEDALQAARYRQLDVNTVLEAAGLPAERLALAGARVSIEQYSEVLRQLRLTSDDAFMGFLSRPIPSRAFPVFAYSVVGCRNLAEVISQANAFYSLFSDEFRWRIEKSRGDTLLFAEVNPVLPVDYRFIIQSLLIMTLRLLGWLLGEDVPARYVQFSFEENPSDESLGYLFGCAVRFEGNANYIRIPSAYSEAVLSCNRDQVTEMLKSTRHLFLVSRKGKPLSQEVRRRLLLGKTERWLEIEEIAGDLGLDKHQLWRRLKKEGTTFLDIRDQIKRDWALALLEDPRYTVEQVAEQLRYADVSAFRKAFRKWTGLQPVAYRAAVTGQ